MNFNADELTFTWPLAVDGSYFVYILIWEGIPGKHGFLMLVMAHMFYLNGAHYP